MELLRLKELLKEKGVAGKDLAQTVGVAPNTISRIAQGTSFPSGEMLKKIAEVLDVDIRDLFIPTKETAVEPIYVEKDGKNIKIGELKLNSSDNSGTIITTIKSVKDTIFDYKNGQIERELALVSMELASQILETYKISIEYQELKDASKGDFKKIQFLEGESINVEQTKIYVSELNQCINELRDLVDPE